MVHRAREVSACSLAPFTAEMREELEAYIAETEGYYYQR